MKELVAKLEGLLRLRSIPVRHEAVRERRGDGGDPEDPPAEGIGAHARPGRGAGGAARLDGGHHDARTWSATSAARWWAWAARTRSGIPASTWSGVWFATPVDAAAHQKAMNLVPAGKYKALAVAPLASGRLDPPDIALFYATPGAMIYFINGLQWSGYKRFDWSVVGESACADSWGRALRTREPSLSIPVLCRAPLRRRARRRDADGAAARTARRRRSPAWRRWRRTASAIRSRSTASSRTCAPGWRSAIPDRK